MGMTLGIIPRNWDKDGGVMVNQWLFAKVRNCVISKMVEDYVHQADGGHP